MAATAGRTDKTPYIIYALAAVQSAIGVYVGTQGEDKRAIQAVADRVTAIEAASPIRREMRDRQFQDLSERLRTLEARDGHR